MYIFYELKTSWTLYGLSRPKIHFRFRPVLAPISYTKLVAAESETLIGFRSIQKESLRHFIAFNLLIFISYKTF